MLITSGRSARRLALAVAALTAASVLAGCGSSEDEGGGGGGDGSATDLDAALEAGGKHHLLELDPQRRGAGRGVRGGVPQRRRRARQRRHQHRGVHEAAERDQGGLGRARRRADRVLRACPQFALADSLVDLSQYGFDELEDDYSASTWGSVNVDGKLVGLPQDSGPMALFYNKAVFDQYGIAVPTTWDEYVDAATPAARGRPDEVHHLRHRRRRLHHEHDLAGRRPPVRHRRHRRHDRPRRRGHAEVDRRLEPARRGATCSRPLPAGATSGSRASATASIATLVDRRLDARRARVERRGRRGRLARRPDADVRRHRRRPPRTAAAASRS